MSVNFHPFLHNLDTTTATFKEYYPKSNKLNYFFKVRKWFLLCLLNIFEVFKLSQNTSWYVYIEKSHPWISEYVCQKFMLLNYRSQTKKKFNWIYFICRFMEFKCAQRFSFTHIIYSNISSCTKKNTHFMMNTFMSCTFYFVLFFEHKSFVYFN